MDMRRGGKERETGGPETNKRTQGEGERCRKINVISYTKETQKQ